MGSRRQEREFALQALYQCDTLEDFSLEQARFYFECFHPEIIASDEPSFAKLLVDGIVASLVLVDGQITAASQNWSLNRMSRVDRNILRLGTYEICFLDDIPVSVSINEAIEVAKRYGADDSPMFINGVLDKVAALQRNSGERTNLPLAANIKKVSNA